MLHQLKAVETTLAETRVQGIAVVLTRGDESIHDFAEVAER